MIALRDLRRACLAAATNKRVEKELGQCFQLKAPAFYLDYNKLGLYTGRSWVFICVAQYC